VEANRQYWSDQQQHFRRLLLHSDRHTEAIDAFLEQHAMLHTASLAPGSRWSFQDEISADLTDQQLRQIPSGSLHSIAWLRWHTARTEDVTINLLLANTGQLLYADRWFERLTVPTRDIGTEMIVADITALSAQIDIAALRAYRRAVGQRTREIVQQVTADELQQIVEVERIERAKAEGALVPAAYGVAEYWGRHTKANLLLIPATRHSFTHLNEAGRVRHKLRRYAY
jgi:DinB superfamily